MLLNASTTITPTSYTAAVADAAAATSTNTTSILRNDVKLKMARVY